MLDKFELALAGVSSGSHAGCGRGSGFVRYIGGFRRCSNVL